MDNKMFCFQCEQTAGCTGCTGSVGVCGKDAHTAVLQDELTGALISLGSRAWKNDYSGKETYRLIIEGLFTTVTNVSFNPMTIKTMIDRVRAENNRLASQNGFWESTFDGKEEYNLENMWKEQEDIRSLKALILFGIRGMSAYAYHSLMLGYSDEYINRFFCEALMTLEKENDPEKLLPLVLKVGEINLKAMELLDKANTESYGKPSPVRVSLTVEKGPFIVVSGHDLKDLELLLKQTSGKGVNVYTHGEMLPAHGYPELRKYSHLKGNFGTAWQNQQKEFQELPGAVLFTTNCLMPPAKNYADRVFTTEMVSFPGIVHIGDDKDFTPVIEKALRLGGYREDRKFTGINGGEYVTTGFGYSSVLSDSEAIIERIKNGKITHFFLVAGCDGAKPGRNYYTEFVRRVPETGIVLTLACGKYRFNDLNLGDIEGIPRLMDMGQCNDAFGAIQVALALGEALGCSVNELPLSFVLSWYEQKAVCILLTLLHLGIKNIKLGPSLPAFLSQGILNYLIENYGIGGITTPEEDMAFFLGNDKEELLKSYLERLGRGENLEEVRKDFVNKFENVDPAMIIAAEEKLMASGTPFTEIKNLCDIHGALFRGNIEKKEEAYSRVVNIPGHPLNTLVRENHALEKLLDELDEKGGMADTDELEKIRQVAFHYAKKGDMIYPNLKTKYGISGPSDVMWTVDDEIRDELSYLAGNSQKNNRGERLKKVLIRIREMIYKENNILFPNCAIHFSTEDWMQIYADSKDYPLCFDIDEIVWKNGEKWKKEDNEYMDEIVMPGGHLTKEELIAMLNTIPLEISFVDKNNINKFFNEGPKVFKRPSMAIDREVFSCHPPKIEPMVRNIIDSFRNGQRDSVPVWMEKQGKTMLVTYMAVRDREGSYIGTLELVQDMENAKKHFRTLHQDRG